ncbi:hypothetical protein GOODEAATRI_023222 [Goodea atripinnis]|uniref:Uncharacterized protein n=1 Tax=Goodea atripinnis TaxID=208336 RepID=A0ABV0NYD6_9TELE
MVDHTEPGSAGGFFLLNGSFHCSVARLGRFPHNWASLNTLGWKKLASVGLLKFGLLFTTFDRFLESIHRQILSKIVFSVSQKSKNLHTSKDFVHSYHRFISF